MRAWNSAILAGCLAVCGPVHRAIGENLAPHREIHHGFLCEFEPCSAVFHGEHEFGAVMSPTDTGGFLVGVPIEQYFFSNRFNSVDDDDNQIADSWEHAYVPGSALAALGDEDGAAH